MKPKSIFYGLATVLLLHSAVFAEDLTITGTLDSKVTHSVYETIRTQGTTVITPTGDVTLGATRNIKFKSGFSVTRGGLLTAIAYTDIDQDLIPNGVEEGSCTDPAIPDTDQDGLIDGREDTNQNGVFESNLGETDPCNPDTDGDGMPDGFEADNSLNPLAYDAYGDPDNDGIPNLHEFQNNTNPGNPDTDGDGMPDGYEIKNNLDPNNNDAQEDTDNDGLTNLEEFQAGTDPGSADTDGDGIQDGEEDLTLTGILDTQAVHSGYSTIQTQGTTTITATGDVTLGAVKRILFKPGFSVTQGGLLSVTALDRDQDLILNTVEDASCTDPDKADTDSDGLIDGREDANRNGTFESNLGETDPCNPDTDGDGMYDGFEVDNYLDPHSNDANEDPDNDNLTNLEEFQNNTNPRNPDTDGDGMPDDFEVNKNLDPNRDDAQEDPDNDGLTNLREFQLGTEPGNPDTDGDGMPDGYEADNNLNPNVKDSRADADGDGIGNWVEYYLGTDPQNPDSAPPKGTHYVYDELGRVKKIIRIN